MADSDVVRLLPAPQVQLFARWMAAKYNTIQYNTKQISIAPLVASESEALGDSV